VTTIAYRAGVLAADSRATITTESGGERMTRCEKLFRKTVKKGRRNHEVIIATAGESAPGLVFVDWYGSGQPPPHQLIEGDADFTCLVLTDDGLHEFDKYCRGERVVHPDFYAIGSGAMAALGAMHAGASAKRAVEIACLVSPGSGPPVVTMRLRPKSPRAPAT
jgi:hypothetical protein